MEQELRQVCGGNQRQEELRLNGRSAAFGGAPLLIGDALQVIGPFNATVAVIGLVAAVVGVVWLLDIRANLLRLADQHASLKAAIAAVKEQN